MSTNNTDDRERCEGCQNMKGNVEAVQVSSGRDYPGVGGAPTPPEYASLCEQCREARKNHAKKHPDPADEGVGLGESNSGP